PPDRHPRPAARGRQRPALRRLAADPVRPEDAPRDRRVAHDTRVTALLPSLADRLTLRSEEARPRSRDDVALASARVRLSETPTRSSRARSATPSTTLERVHHFFLHRPPWWVVGPALAAIVILAQATINDQLGVLGGFSAVVERAT